MYYKQINKNFVHQVINQLRLYLELSSLLGVWLCVSLYIQLESVC
jgi:hypothetical protein